MKQQVKYHNNTRQIRSDVYLVIMYLHEMVITEIPLNKIIFYSKQKAIQNNRRYSKEQIIEAIHYLQNIKLIKKSKDDKYTLHEQKTIMD